MLSPTNMPAPLTGWRHVSAGPGEEVWAISSSGIVCRRHGTTKDNPAGTTWSHGVVVSFTIANNISVHKMFLLPAHFTGYSHPIYHFAGRLAVYNSSWLDQ